MNCRSITDFLTIVSDKNTSAFNRLWATRAVAPDISKAYIFGPTVFLLYISDLPHNVICNNVIRLLICGNN